MKGEILDGENKYNCEEFNKKIPVLKRLSIKKLSDIVIIRLNRFEFDYTTFERIKLNDYLEFPQTLNFKAWMRSTIVMQNKEDNKNLNLKDIVISENEAMESEDSKFELSGVLVHSGGSEGGHYYSFINDKDSCKWYEFNDGNVSDFNIANLKNECFGSEEKDNFDIFSSKSKNAYLLFYRRIKAKPNTTNNNTNITSRIVNFSLTIRRINHPIL